MPDHGTRTTQDNPYRVNVFGVSGGWIKVYVGGRIVYVAGQVTG